MGTEKAACSACKDASGKPINLGAGSVTESEFENVCGAMGKKTKIDGDLCLCGGQSLKCSHFGGITHTVAGRSSSCSGAETTASTAGRVAGRTLQARHPLRLKTKQATGYCQPVRSRA